MMDVPRRVRAHGKVQVVESSLPPVSKTKSSRRRQKARGRASVQRRQSDKPATRSRYQPEIPSLESEYGSAPEIVLVDKQSICIDILANGYVQSFVDFFYLTHRPDPVQTSYGIGQEPAEIDVSIEDMEVIKGHLVEAEAARRKPDQVDNVYSNLNDLARHFQDNHDQRTGIYFYEKYLEIARMMQDVTGEMKATHDLGNAYLLMKDYLKAAEYQEQHLKLAQAHKDTAPEQVGIAYNQLKTTYTAYGELKESEGKVEEAVEFHRKCLAAAQKTDDKTARSSTHYRLGRALVQSNKREDIDEGKSHLHQSLELCNELGDIRGQGLAFSALAAMAQKMKAAGGNNDEAVEHLKNFLRVSESTGNLKAQAEACHNLGVIYNQEGRFDRAVEFFEKNFRLSRRLVKEENAKTSVVDKARIDLGMAKGNQRLGKYMHIINSDLKTLLYWKNSRQDIR